MTMQARFTHVNLVAQDWRKVARFYESVLGCVPVPPERNLSGKWLEESTSVRGAAIRGVHLRLPGWSEGGPTLEVFQYSHEEERPRTAVNCPGLGHLAFAVDDVEAACREVLAAGGNAVGKLTSVDVPGAGTVTFIYVTDPEGNVIELQHWSGRSQASAGREP
jgi:catechol 2,3-dioxygenase-like lactoylglutathione lyase family enzyme